MHDAGAVATIEQRAAAYRDQVLKAMTALRADGDKLESVVDARIWPLPTYAEMLFLR